MTDKNDGVEILGRLFATIDSRRGADPETSRTARLFARGPARMAQKVGEEAVETLIEALTGNRDKLVAESADLLYHLFVLWAACGVAPADVWAELARRHTEGAVDHKPPKV